jgi:hypothetical protein
MSEEPPRSLSYLSAERCWQKALDVDTMEESVQMIEFYFKEQYKQGYNAGVKSVTDQHNKSYWLNKERK